MKIEDLKPGDMIRLNDKAREWTCGLVFVIDEVRLWGVVCWTVLPEGRTGYRASWDQIEGVEPANTAESGFGGEVAP